jgi:hypothetical protein
MNFQIEVRKMNTEKIWFSHRERKWDTTNGTFSWTDTKEIWDWDNCTIGIVRTPNEGVAIVVRSKTNKNSQYMGNKPVELRFMLGFTIHKISEPQIEQYTARKNFPEKSEGPKDRWVFQMDNDYWIWEWANEGSNISSSSIYRLYKSINEELSSPSMRFDNIFDTELEDLDSKIIPVIYQPAVDSLDNFVREIHCAETSANVDGTYDIEISIIFNNEELRRHAYGGTLDKIYGKIRGLLYGRTLDIETFKIRVRKDLKSNTLVFENIYSDNYQLEDDSIHGDPPIAPERNGLYFFTHNRHPVIFINTSNHAMAEHDTNRRLWKWEYVPWLSNAPIKLGNKTREEIEKEFKPLFRFR